MVVVSSKVASKALGLVASDRESAVAAATVRVVAERTMPDGRVTRVVESASGPVMAAAGVDASNTGGSDGVLLLPTDPDGVCASLLAALQRAFGVTRLGVVLSDTSGRPWREGQVDFALGAAGLTVLDDLRGAVDADGRPLAVTARAIADEVAAAADLVKGKVDAVPGGTGPGARRLRDGHGGRRRAVTGPDRAGRLVRDRYRRDGAGGAGGGSGFGAGRTRRRSRPSGRSRRRFAWDGRSRWPCRTRPSTRASGSTSDPTRSSSRAAIRSTAGSWPPGSAWRSGARGSAPPWSRSRVAARTR